MSDQDIQPEEAPEVLTAPFAVQEGDWTFDPFVTKAMLPINKRQQVPMWVQAQNRSDVDAIRSSDPLMYGRKFTVAVRKSPMPLIPEGIEVQVVHGGTNGTITLDVDWFKASLYAAKRDEYSQYLPEVELNAEVVNQVAGTLRANDGTHPSNEFSHSFCG